LRNIKQEFEFINEELEDITAEIRNLKSKRQDLRQKKREILEKHCKYRNEKKGICDYDNSPLNKEGYYCSDCVSAGYSHISIKL